MAKEYVPVFFDWTKVTEELNDAEKGRLIDAMVLYASGGDWQSCLQGNERFLFPAFREQINRGNDLSEIRANARKQNKSNQTGTKSNKQEQTESNATNANEEEKEEEEEYEKEKENNVIAHVSQKRQEKALLLARFQTFWASYPRKTDKKKALDAFMKINPDDALLKQMLESLSKWRQTAQWQDEGGRYIPHPTTWLHNRRWEDEVPAVQAAHRTTVVAQDYGQRDYNQQQQNPDDVLDRAMQMMRGGDG